MGYLLAEGKFSATLSRHNSKCDRAHDKLWLDFIAKLDKITKMKKYKEINLMFDANVEDMREED